ncbi:MAG: Lon protease family protein, partial [Spirochaetota bacterium]
MGAALIPLKDGKPMEEEELQSLSEKEQKELEKKRDEIQEEMKKMQKDMRQLQRKQQDASRGVDRQVVMNVVGGLMDDLREKYEEYNGIGAFLDDVQEDILENIQKFKMHEQQAQAQQPLQDEQIKQQLHMMREQTLKQYKVNVIVDNSGQEGAPVILELNPRYYNLVGRIEKEMQMGAVTTDFTLIKAGAILKANGGYLVIPVEELVRDYYSWDSLKRALQAEELRVEELAEQIGYMTIKTLRPQPIPLDLKVVLVGIPLIHHLLQSRVADFSELFKVKADFDTRMEKVDGNIKNFLGFVKNLCDEENLLPIDREGTQKLLEHVIRKSGHRERISTEFGSISDIIREASYWANQENNDIVTAVHVRKTLEEQEYRSNLVQHHVEEMIEQGTLLIHTEGTATGQVNGLSIMMMGDHRFGRPNRITATVYPGKDGLVDIEREVKLGGPLHSKGIMILGGYLGMKYSRDKQLSISARLVFEQSYTGIDGDSASQAELYCLLSALSGKPIEQGIAVTGSVNQHGQVQAIGGVNEKIEGYFSVCKKIGLSGKQGVIIPESNVQNLVLKDEVIDAVGDGSFNLWAVSSIDEGIEILTGEKAGALQEDGQYPDGSVNRLVSDTLEMFSQVTRKSGNNKQDYNN